MCGRENKEREGLARASWLYSKHYTRHTLKCVERKSVEKHESSKWWGTRHLPHAPPITGVGFPGSIISINPIDQDYVGGLVICTALLIRYFQELLQYIQSWDVCIATLTLFPRPSGKRVMLGILYRCGQVINSHYYRNVLILEISCLKFVSRRSKIWQRNTDFRMIICDKRVLW